jgi:broad specificity phosphatase PhoE
MSVLVLCRHVRDGDRQQAERLADALAPLEPAAIYTSPLRRAARTAAAVAARHGLEPVTVEALREIDRGDVEGLAFDDYPEELQAGLLESPGTVRFPGGESFADLEARACGALDEFLQAHEGSCVVAISHAGPIRAAFARWLELSPDASFRIDQSNGAVNVIEFVRGVPFVRLVNGTSPQLSATATMPGSGRARRPSSTSRST